MQVKHHYHPVSVVKWGLDPRRSFSFKVLVWSAGKLLCCEEAFEMLQTSLRVLSAALDVTNLLYKN